jgi:hypothetical protein
MRLSDARLKYEGWLSIQEAYRLTGVCPQKIKRLIKARVINPLELYRVRMTYTLISPEDIQKIIENKGKIFKEEY